MAAPLTKTLQSLSGKWKLNKDFSDDFSPVLELQGINAMIRKATSLATVYLDITQPSRDTLEMKQTATAASIPGTTESYVLDWEWRTDQDAFFGDIEGRSRWVARHEVKNDKIGKDGEWIEGDSEGMLIHAVGKKPDGAWVATHYWGFEQVEGARRHTRRVHVRAKDGEELRVRMVYDFVSE